MTSPAPAIAARAKRRRTGSLLIAAGAFAFAAMVLTMLTRVEPIVLVGLRLDHSGNQVFVEGTVRNTGGDADGLSLQVSYFDSKGRKVGQDVVPLARLRAGAEAGFRGPSRQLDDAADFTVAIDRGRNPYGN